MPVGMAMGENMEGGELFEEKFSDRTPEKKKLGEPGGGKRSEDV